MTGHFDTYIYTNCRADEGLQGRDGFQFQAISPEANLDAMSLVQRRLLYEPSPQWMRDRRPVSDYPPSLAHVHDGLYATAAGVYLGRESSGGREGNQLTHAIATSHGGDYGLVRPAQLFGAPFWTTVPAPTRQCPPLDPGWQPGPFGVLEAQRFVRAQDRGTALLTALLSHLRRTASDRRRVLFLARDPEPVLRWVTAATLLIPHRLALGIDFKIFTLNPAYADHRILAVHPDWSTGAASLDNQLGYVVFDLTRHDWTPVREDQDSRRWVDLFVSEDPYDVADAVEVAAAAAAAYRPLGTARTAFAVAVVLGHPPEKEAFGPIIGWLRANPPDLVERYGGELVDQLLSTPERWPPAELFQLDAAVREVLPHRAAAVRLALLRAEIETGGPPPDRRADRPARPLPPIDRAHWNADAETAATDLLADAMRVAPPDRFERLLRLAKRFGVAPPHPLLEPGLQRFIEHWAQHPEVDHDPRAWAGADEIKDKLRVLLARRLDDDPDVADDLGADWWETLLNRPNGLTTALDQALVAAAMAGFDAEPRATFVGEMLTAAAGAAEPLDAIQHTVDVLWRRTVPNLPETNKLVKMAPPELELGAEVFPALTGALFEEPVPNAIFDVAYLLAERRRIWLPPAAVRERIAVETSLRFVLARIGRTEVDPHDFADAMHRIPASTVEHNRKALVQAVMRAPLAASALAVVEAAPALRPAYTRRISRALLTEQWQPQYMAAAYVLNEMPPSQYNKETDYQVLTQLDKTVVEFVERGSSGRLEEVNRQIAELDEPWRVKWATYLRTVRPRGAIGRFIPRRR